VVEVKRGTDTRIRREVVGQMLDYAANAVSAGGADRADPGERLQHRARASDPRDRDPGRPRPGARVPLFDFLDGVAGVAGGSGPSRERVQHEARLREVARGLNDRDLGLALTLAEAMAGR